MGWLSVAWLFAAGGEDNPAPKGAGQSPDIFSLVLPFIPIAILFYFLMLRPQRKEQAARETMLSALKKNDKVVTIGGIIATVANISSDGQEVTLKVDDNTRVKFTRSAIQRVVSTDGEGEKPAETK